MSTDNTTTPPPPPRGGTGSWQDWGEGSAGTGRVGSRPVRTSLKGAPSADDAAASADVAGSAASADAARADGVRPGKKAIDVGPRRVRLSVARIDPWSVMKLSFLLSVAIGIMMVVGAAIVWFVLDGMQVFAKVQGLLTELGSDELLALMEYVQLDRVMSMTTILAVADIVILTALATLMAFLYNITASLVGGLHLTLTDD